MKGLTKRKDCRVCGNTEFDLVLDLGSMPPANAFIKKSEFKKEQKFPLVVYRCRRCGLVQLLHVIDPKILFRHYDYMTSASKPLAEHFVTLAKDTARKLKLRKSDLAVEIGGNDGVLLGALKGTSRVLNVDPAKNVAAVARKHGVPTMIDFFSEEVARKILATHGPARVIFANNVMAHIDDLHDIFRGVRTLIGHNGVFISEVHWVGNLIGRGGFDQVYHEHLCYYSLSAYQRLVEQFGLDVVDVETVPMHGESLRISVAAKGLPSPRVEAFLARERKMGLDNLGAYKKFAQKVSRNKRILRTMLEKAKRQGKMMAGYGAPAKGNTLLNYFGIGPRFLAFLTDTTPFKQGLYSPGMHIPVVSPDKLKTQRPDYLLLLSWNYADAILKREKELRKQGVKFIIPVPEARIVR